ncbi:MAG: glucosaminidase domain-containing protein [Candidatus Dojkabacteria bacterium]|nr:MAG: glucosaminidase domain-containing protein [Candidatus Dojkabacteria bacterium]
MQVPLNYKRKALVLVVMILLSGNFVNVFSQLQIDDNIITEHSAFAASEYRKEFVVPVQYDFTQDAAKQAIVDQRVEDLKYSQENIRKLESYLSKRGSPMASQAKTFEKMAVKYGLPYNLMPAIAVIESGAGRHNYRPYNYAGMGGQGGALSFTSYEQAIEKHAQILRFGYFDKGADTPHEIGRYYCYQCPTWGYKVQGVMNEIDRQ